MTPTGSSSSAAGSAAWRPPGPSAAHRSRSPSSTGRTITCSSRCSTRWPPARSPRARSRRRCAACCAGRRTRAVVLADVRGFDLERRAVRATGPGGEDLTLDYDTLIVAAGAGHAYAGHDAWAEHAPALKTLADARRIRSRVLGAFERAELAGDPAERDAWLRFAVVGGGADRRRARGADRRARAPDPAARLRGHRHPDRADRAARGRARPAARLPGGAAAPRGPRPRAAGRRRAHGRRGVRRGRGRRRGAVR